MHADHGMYSWRRVADPGADKALAEVVGTAYASTGADMLESLQRCAQEQPGSLDCAAFLAEASQIPPDGIIATPEDVMIAQDFFADYLLEVIISLIYYAVAAGSAGSARGRERVSGGKIARTGYDSPLSTAEKRTSRHQYVWPADKTC